MTLPCRFYCSLIAKEDSGVANGFLLGEGKHLMSNGIIRPIHRYNPLTPSVFAKSRYDSFKADVNHSSITAKTANHFPITC